jgi:RimJ/RimL family protein N-acetyltransferase
MTDGEDTAGTRPVTLRLATEADERDAYEWCCRSDITHRMMGPPLYPDNPPDTWEEFHRDWGAYFSDRDPQKGRCFLIRVDGRSVGLIAHNDICRHADGHTFTELDIWLRDSACCGRGYGPRAVEALCRLLHDELGVTEFFLQPSARNEAAVRAYAKIGFRAVDLDLETAARIYQTQRDYRDSLFMTRRWP